MTSMYSKSFDNADEIKTPPKAHVSVVKLGDMNASKMVLEPGWKWSECIKPTVGGDSCQAGHVGVIIQGQLMCVHDDGTEVLAKAGDAYYFAPGHDGWVVGDDTVIAYEIVGAGKDFGPWQSAQSATKSQGHQEQIFMQGAAGVFGSAYYFNAISLILTN